MGRMTLRKTNGGCSWDWGELEQPNPRTPPSGGTQGPRDPCLLGRAGVMGEVSRLNNSIQFLDTSSVRIGLKFVLLDFSSDFIKNLLFDKSCLPLAQSSHRSRVGVCGRTSVSFFFAEDSRKVRSAGQSPSVPHAALSQAAQPRNALHDRHLSHPPGAPRPKQLDAHATWHYLETTRPPARMPACHRTCTTNQSSKHVHLAFRATCHRTTAHSAPPAWSP